MACQHCGKVEVELVKGKDFCAFCLDLPEFKEKPKKKTKSTKK